MSNLKKVLKLNALETPVELQIKTVTQQATQPNTEQPIPTCRHCKNHVTIKITAVISSERKTKTKTTRMVPAKTTTIPVVRQFLTSTTRFQSLPTQSIQTIKKRENLDLSAHLARPVVKLTIAHKNVTLEQMQLIIRLPRTDGRKDRIRSNREMLKTIQMFKSQPKR